MDTNKFIIGFYSPRPQSGKSTAATFLEQHYNFNRVSFTAPVKSMLQTFFEQWDFQTNLISELANAGKETPLPFLNGKSYRQLAQALGTEWGRNIDRDLWVRLAIKKIKSLPYVVVDDLRFPNEYWAIVRAGCVVVKVERKAAKLTHSHKSEGQLNNYWFDAILKNDGSLQNYKASIVKLLQKLGR